MEVKPKKQHCYMRIKTYALIIAIITLCLITTSAHAATIKDGTILYPPGSYLAGTPLKTGVDPFGYNYQAHTFAGSYFNAYANDDGLPPYNGDDAAYLAANPTAATHWAWPYRKDQLGMNWNDAWLSNEDKNNDGKLDRPATYIGSSAWLKNKQSGDYVLDGEEISWNYNCKIVAVPADANHGGGTPPELSLAAALNLDMWYDASGKEIGPVIWGDFAIIQEVYNDPGVGAHGVLYHSPAGPGLGKYR
jgi:hypothetical protein